MKKLLFILILNCIISLSAKHYSEDPKLAQLFSWPTQKPSVGPDSHSLFGNAPYMIDILKKVPNECIIVELGSWLGASTRFLLQQKPDGFVIAIDHWKGSPEHNNVPDFQSRLPRLYETFLVNCWQYQNRLIPLKMTTVEGLEVIYKSQIRVDFIYVDAAHDTESVLRDIRLCFEYFPSAVLTGDDWSWPTVRKAVEIFASEKNLKIYAIGNFWYLYYEKSN